MATTPIVVRCSEELLAAVDRARGATPRNTWALDVITRAVGPAPAASTSSGPVVRVTSAEAKRGIVPRDHKPRSRSRNDYNDEPPKGRR